VFVALRITPTTRASAKGEISIVGGIQRPWRDDESSISSSIGPSISAPGARAQVLSANFKPLPNQTERMEFESTLIEPRQPEANRVLPDAPIAKVPASVCPAGVGRPCAFLGGRPYIPDQFHLVGHNPSWVKAVSNPAIVVVRLFRLPPSLWTTRRRDTASTAILQEKRIPYWARVVRKS
jgi:hypothetical protein